jgi:hypothetical protein
VRRLIPLTRIDDESSDTLFKSGSTRRQEAAEAPARENDARRIDFRKART